MIAISVSGVLDHRHKDAVVRRLNRAPWYCAHDHVRCGEAKRDTSLERGWDEREVGYESALVLIGAATLSLVVRVLYQAQSVWRQQTP